MSTPVQNEIIKTKEESQAQKNRRQVYAFSTPVSLIPLRCFYLSVIAYWLYFFLVGAFHLSYCTFVLVLLFLAFDLKECQPVPLFGAFVIYPSPCWSINKAEYIAVTVHFLFSANVLKRVCSYYSSLSNCFSNRVDNCWIVGMPYLVILLNRPP